MLWCMGFIRGDDGIVCKKVSAHLHKQSTQARKDSYFLIIGIYKHHNYIDI
jgi:hypothetical protein